MTEGGGVLERDVPSIWQKLTKPAAIFPSFSGRAEVDVAIVGGGVSGLSIAYHLAREGGRPMVLEAARCGAGALGASAGIIAPQLVRTTPRAVLARLGQETGSRLLRLVAESGNYTFDLVRTHGLECGASQAGFLAPARTAAAVRHVSELFREWQPFRRDLELVDARAVSQLSGCRGYECGLLDNTGGGLNPLAYARELARLAAMAGASIHEDSRVIALRQAAHGWSIRTEAGEVSAARVMLCANGSNPWLHPALKRTVIPLPVYEVATGALGADVRSTILPAQHVLTDVEADVLSLRWADDNRLITAYPAAAGADHQALEAAVNRRLAAVLQLRAAQRLEFAWHGVAWINQGLLPRLVGVTDSLVAVQACNGRGIAVNTILGREVARWLVSPGSYRPEVPVEAPRNFRWFGVARHVPRFVLAAAMARRRLTRSR